MNNSSKDGDDHCDTDLLVEAFRSNKCDRSDFLVFFVPFKGHFGPSNGILCTKLAVFLKNPSVKLSGTHRIHTRHLSLHDRLACLRAFGPFRMCPCDAVSAQLLERTFSRVADIRGGFCYVLVNLTRQNHCPHLLCLLFP